MSDRRKTLIKVNVRQAEGGAKNTNYLQAVNDVINLMNEKKISKENAFDIQITSLEDLKEFLDNNQNMETKWLRTGEAIGAGAKIYGFRVDNVHSNTYKMISTLARNGGDGEEIQIIGQNDELSDEENLAGPAVAGAKSAKIEGSTNRKLRKFKFSQSDGEKTMEKLENIDIKKYDLNTILDPLFKKTSQKFDELGPGNLMTSSLNINSHLLLQLDSQMDVVQSNPIIQKDSLEPIAEEDSEIADQSQIVEQTQSFDYLSSLNQYYNKMKEHLINSENFKRNIEPKEFERPLISKDLDEYITCQNEYIQYTINAPEDVPGGFNAPIEVDEGPEEVAPDALEYDEQMSNQSFQDQDSPEEVQDDHISVSGGINEFLNENEQSSLNDPLCFVGSQDSSMKKDNIFSQSEFDSLDLGKFAQASDTNESSLIGAMVDGTYDKSLTFNDFNQSQLGDGKSLKMHLDTYRDITEVKIQNLRSKETAIMSEDQKIEKKNTLKQQKADQNEKDRFKIQQHLYMGQNDQDWKKSKLAMQLQKAKTGRVPKVRKKAIPVASLQQLMEHEKSIPDENQMSLSYNYGFWRITQLFGRCLYIKYYRKTEMKKDDQFIGFDGAIEGGEEAAENIIQGEPDIHFEEMTAPEGFNNYNQIKSENGVKDMIRDKKSQQFFQPKMAFNHLSRNMDVKKLKKQLWSYIDPKVSDEEPKTVLMSDVLSDLYYGEQNEQNPQISINSVFICMLHLANEKNLNFEGLDEIDFEVSIK